MKRTSAEKRTKPPLKADYTKAFSKDWLRLSHSGRYDLNRLKQVMLLIIANSGDLPPEWLDHPLTGNWATHRKCHIGGDFLLIYQYEDSKQSVIFVRAGTHAELFD